MSNHEAWACVERLYKVYDRSNSRKLNLDQLVEFVSEVRKMEIIDVDEPHIVQKLQETNAEHITFSEFKAWSHGPEGPPAAVKVTVDSFGNNSIVPERFTNAHSFVHNVKVQHPCFTTAAHDLGIKGPNQVDMPMKWRGKAGDFTRDYEMREPGKNTITVNNYANRGLRTNKTFSKVHKEFDIDW